MRMFYRVRCRHPRSDKDPKPYCEESLGRTFDFDRLARFFEAHGFFEPPKERSYQSVWIDVPETTISAVREGKTFSIEIGSRGDGTLDEWGFEKAVRGVADGVDWSTHRETARCPVPSPP